MLNLARKNTFYAVFLFVIALVYLPKLALADSILYTDWLTEGHLTYLGSLSRLLFLILGFVLAWRVVGCFDEDNPVRPAWNMLAWGLFSYLLGQIVLVGYQLVLGKTAPFPSLGDLFFLLAMLLWFVSLGRFVRAYAQAGFLEGGVKQAVVLSIVVILLLMSLSLGVLFPLLTAPAPFAEKALNIAYPVTDLLLLIPVLVLFQMTLKLRGGRLWRVWMALLLGFIFLTLGDILFAYFTTMEMEFLDPLLDVMFTYCYIFLAWGTSLQYSILND